MITKAILSRYIGRALLKRQPHGAFQIRFSSASSSGDNTSEPKQITREEAKSRAQEILAFFPGETNLGKATYATITGGLTAFLVANNIYIPNDETLILVAFIIVVRALYVKLGQPISDMLTKGINEIRESIDLSRTQEIGSLSKEVAELEQYRDFADVRADLFKTRQENILLEAQLAELAERNRFLASIKVKLDEAVRRGSEKQAAERRATIDAIMAGVLKELENPKLQNAIIKRSIEDLQRLPSQAN